MVPYFCHFSTYRATNRTKRTDFHTHSVFSMYFEDAVQVNLLFLHDSC